MTINPTSSGNTGNTNGQDEGHGHAHTRKQNANNKIEHVAGDSESPSSESPRVASSELTLSDIESVINDAKESLQPLAPGAGVERYLQSIRTEVTENTVQEYARKLELFIKFAEENQIENLNSLDGRLVDSYRIWRREDSTDKVDSLGKKTLRDDMYLFRAFLSYMESIEAVKSDLSDSVRIPQLNPGDGVRDVELPRDRVEEIISYLNKYEYATTEHVVWLIHCSTGRRPGALHSLDLEDFCADDKEPYLHFKHRGGTTRLKNEEQGEALVNIPESISEVLKDYVEENWDDVTDDDGRSPFLTSTHGRLSKPTMRKYFYKWSRPCAIGHECPHGREVADCEAAASAEVASKCPSSQSPYSARHGYLSQMRREGLPIAILSERCDVSEEMLKKHYDERTEDEKRELRRKLLAEVENQGGGFL
ncbi:tyrosine-type recombinase/integrase [Halobium salinum]|uniref:Tyrosine-type recombinase/integrase n=1 Tax=Halobium salinum TaxID=1364940 RepID=A0ABD5P6N3_9EURY|nr:site-specific integrase [Halobium salinum]